MHTKGPFECYAINSIWSIVGYTVLLCFTLFKTSAVAKSILGAH